MNEIEFVVRDLRESYPNCSTKLHVPRNTNGSWFLDVSLDGHIVTCVWSARRGFGLTASREDVGYGEGPEEVYYGYYAQRDTTLRIMKLLETKSFTEAQK